ncbi:TAXI family TRAP transporter solute-binding subunit [Polynucleobacter kasalickyi]|uniref:TRAP transporter solute receptor, TAXI family n=1 Tax=Polynucleobacter kasalickyi TaxID=1938817 RepID=A0A1W1YMT6_9BURK|nr:TAXI family TRAP transporter solute-binding subunit [Polynucleobacter kasalickyi]SMC37497.1 TRAP transporter solute receptor, TAXI family [Polynucleobacter kasalickyi]
MDIYNLPKKAIYIATVVFFVLVGVFFLAMWYLVPSIPRTVVIATGAKTGLYYRFGEDFKRELEKNGVKVELKVTAGSVENLKLISDKDSDVDLALVQSGVANEKNNPDLVSIAGVFYEPYWIWYRGDAFKEVSGNLNNLQQLKGKRVAIGAKGSGTNTLSKELLKIHGIDASQIELFEISPDEALKKIQSKEIDATCFAVGVDAPILEKFYRLPGVSIMDFDQADSYVRQLPYLSKVYIPHGNVSLEFNQPPKNIHVIASTAALVARNDVSPGFVNLIMEVLYDLLKNYTRIQEVSEFPSSTRLDLPLQSDAENYMKEGPSFLYRNLPYWLAVWVVRLLKIALPVLAIGIPVATYLPSLFSFKLNLKLGKIYLALRKLEGKVLALEQSERSLQDIRSISAELHELDHQVSSIKIPTLHSDKYFEIKSYIDVLRIRLNEMAQSKT